MIPAMKGWAIDCMDSHFEEEIDWEAPSVDEELERLKKSNVKTNK